MGLFNDNEEKEVSTGATIGYFLIGFAILVVIAFGIFVGVKKIGGDSETSDVKTVVEESTNVEISEECRYSIH